MIKEQGYMNKTQELENEIVDYIMDNWGSNETEVKINYSRGY